MLTGDRVVRIEWLPGSDTLVGTCHCTARHEAQDPIAMWEWMLAHPEGHVPATAAEPAPDAPDTRVPAPV
jgi:hypothetical protein